MRTDALIDAFLQHVAEEGRKASTRVHYAKRLRLFRAAYGAREFRKRREDEPPDVGLTAAEINQFLRERFPGKSTRRCTATVIALLQKFGLSGERPLLRPDERVFETLERPPMGERDRLPRPDEVERLLAGASPEFSRVYRALLQCGARPGEICRLRIETHLLWEQRKIKLGEHKTERHGKPREISIGKKFEVLLREAIGTRTEGFVFLTPRGKAWTPARIAAVHSGLREKAGLPKELVPYCARHRFATDLFKLTKDIKTVSVMLGHKKMTTADRYTHPNVGEMGDLQDQI